MTTEDRIRKYAQKMYALAHKRGVSHDEVLGFIKERHGVDSSLKLTREQINAIRDVIRVLPIVPESERPVRSQTKHETTGEWKCTDA